MLLFVGILLFICLYRSKVLVSKTFDTDNYISRTRTQSINGIFVSLILLSHTYGITDTHDGLLDVLYNPARVFLGQFVVVTFLFYSGYGIMESILRKKDYMKSFPKKRLLKLWIQFACISVIYVILNLILRTDESLFTYVFSFTGLTTIGNGGWFMFAIFILYLIIILSFSIFKKKPLRGAILTTILVVGVIITELLLDFPSYFFSTLIFFPAGMLFSFIQKTFLKIVTKNHLIWGCLTVISIVGFALLKSISSILFFPIWCGFGLLMVLLISLKVKFENPILIWLGQNAFPVFMLQGIPQMIVPLFNIPVNIISYLIVFVSTIGLVFLFNFIMKLLAKRNKQAVTQ